MASLFSFLTYSDTFYHWYITQIMLQVKLKMVVEYVAYYFLVIVNCLLIKITWLGIY